MKHLVIIHDGPYGTEKACSALRLAMGLQGERPGDRVRVFLLADAVHCALPDQVTPNEYYSVARMLGSVVARGGEVRACGSCASARGLGGLPLIEGVELGTMVDLTNWVAGSDRVVSL